MNEDIFIVAIIFGSVVSIVFFGILGSIIKAWLKKGNTQNLSENKEFLKALREYKENMEQRVSDLEEIVLEERINKVSAKKNQRGFEKNNSIEIEMEEESKNKKEEKQSSKLRNMLNQ